ncbi:discoidin domain-containing protein [Nocardioides campestrisoli]|uniref:discoidin domain-containing protein n=1 Tax=Nocardioides campestrisoli TaxID=2736757 RepID=UPI00163D9E56|nr:discoidin domain-containing protein [Nocardioides campestrisoli]
MRRPAPPRSAPPSLRSRLGATLALGLVGSLAAVVSAPTAAQAAEVPTEPFDSYVALGDSFTAGPLIPPTALAPCARSTTNYPRMLADRLGLDLTDVSCSSARTEHMANPQAGILGTARPQFEALRPDTDLVTLGIGGNDGGLFGTLISRCPEVAPTDPDGAPCRDEFTQDGVDTMAAKIAQTKSDVLGVLDGIRARSPYATVAVVGYLRLMPENGSCTNGAVPMTRQDMLWADGLQRQLNTALAEAAAERGARFVDTYGPSRGHDACAGEDAWVQGKWIDVLKAMEYHPFASGMDATARLVYETLFGTDLARGQAVQASGTEHRFAPSYAVDHDSSTRWASGEWADGAWIQVDLGQRRWVDRVALNWEKAYPQGYRLEVSDDGEAWRPVWTTINSDGGHDTASFEATPARYVRLTAEKRATRYGISLFDLEVYGPDRPVDPAPPTSPAPPSDPENPASGTLSPGLEPARVQATVLSGGQGSKGRVDRVRVRLRDGSTAVVRLMGVRQPRAACRPAARRVMAKQLRPGRTVTLVRDRRTKVDKRVPGRYVMVKRKDLGKQLVRRGQLRVAKGTFTRKKAYKKVQKVAKSSRRGHWGRC